MSQPDPSSPVVAAVVVTFNRLRHLKKTLARLLSEPLDHVVVVENGSTDGTRDWLAGQAIRGLSSSKCPAMAAVRWDSRSACARLACA
ncbi:glycosyltransferase [Paracoccus sp. MKU1]|uniref:glycosyltransferase n=1 Tax=Paracoccus sp. MKU1 TaxID=1745182 RepID=UPI001EF12B4E|nr:glycosyltransferase [Paracoccus sp. MKU1]